MNDFHKKQEVLVKNRSNSSTDITNSIRQKAYELWKKDGCKQGRDLEYWLKAEKTVKSQPSNKF